MTLHDVKKTLHIAASMLHYFGNNSPETRAEHAPQGFELCDAMDCVNRRFILAHFDPDRYLNLADPETVQVLAAALHAAPVLYHSLDTEPGDWLSSKDVAAALLRELMGEPK